MESHSGPELETDGWERSCWERFLPPRPVTSCHSQCVFDPSSLSGSSWQLRYDVHRTRLAFLSTLHIRARMLMTFNIMLRCRPFNTYFKSYLLYEWYALCTPTTKLYIWCVCVCLNWLCVGKFYFEVFNYFFIHPVICIFSILFLDHKYTSVIRVTNV